MPKSIERSPICPANYRISHAHLGAVDVRVRATLGVGATKGTARLKCGFVNGRQITGNGSTAHATPHPKHMGSTAHATPHPKHKASPKAHMHLPDSLGIIYCMPARIPNTDLPGRHIAFALNNRPNSVHVVRRVFVLTGRRWHASGHHSRHDGFPTRLFHFGQLDGLNEAAACIRGPACLRIFLAVKVEVG